ncbi:putative transcriptional regulator [Motilibacter rhizosphaerae]|uniref:Putative transcriptional regulator n=1 Tax=Motilibacter rhizosphaerae TaxID=598652 RepID=A0A4Q7NFP7_9ACTN|nr:putative transcriptional regulator [Motilibacter rhizosphaerae]
MISSVRRPRGSLEAEVLAVLAAAPEPLTPAAVQRALDQGAELAYTTVTTVLVRLHDKGLVTRERAGRAYLYAAVSGPDSVEVRVAARRMRKLLDSGADRRGVLARFVAELPADDEAVLADLLAQAERAPGSAAAGG